VHRAFKLTQPGRPGAHRAPKSSQPGRPGVRMATKSNQPGRPGAHRAPKLSQPGRPGAHRAPKSNQPGRPGAHRAAESRQQGAQERTEHPNRSNQGDIDETLRLCSAINVSLHRATLFKQPNRASQRVAGRSGRASQRVRPGARSIEQARVVERASTRRPPASEREEPGAYASWVSSLAGRAISL
jgi:hypothetical protein